MTELLGSGFTDTFRYFYPDAEGIYSWWSYRFKAREKNAGWRIDYFITSKRINDNCKRQRSIPMCSVQTTALLRLILNFKFKVMYFTIPYATPSSRAHPHPGYTQQHYMHRLCMRTFHCHPDNARSCPCPDMSVY